MQGIKPDSDGAARDMKDSTHDSNSAKPNESQGAGLDWAGMERECRRRWSDAKLFEAQPDSSRPKKFITVAYPYPNSPQHIGHGRTYTLADVHARYWRLKGYNVLFPMGFHYTGTPILGMARRVQDGDAEIVKNLRDIYGVPDKDIASFVDPLAIAKYFHKEIKSGMKEMGYSIDWRREFTTIDPAYSKFIEWQISILKKKGLIIRGSHPVGWCPKDQNPVSQHDTLGDVEPSFTEYVMIKFPAEQKSEYVMPVATLRPETIFGVTNLWVNPGLTYKKITVMPDNQKLIVSTECAYKLEFLGKTITCDGEIAGADLVGDAVRMPFGPRRSIPILAAQFVEPGVGTGIVMSVPAHAPYDWQALRDASNPATYDKSMSEVVARISPISIIKTSGCSDMPAEEAVAAMTPQCTGQKDARLEDVTKELYSKEFYGGVMKDVGVNAPDAKIAGSSVREARETIGRWLSTLGCAESLLEITDAPVRCRCGTKCVVKVLSDQWFLNYGDAAWKESAHKCLADMRILPDEIRQEFGHVVDWLHERACARQHGLGTRLPWDKDWIVESLSDSVIYMAYYTISRFVNDGTVSPGQMTQKFFDWVFLGENGDGTTDNNGSISRISAELGIPYDILQEIRREFSYFYPVDYRHSGRDLVPNHLTFFVLNHAAIFEQKMWPRGIVVNGSVLMDGSKMSKSMGNIIPLRKAVRDYGADPIRLAIITSAELLQDADFNMESVHGMRSKLESMHSECKRLGAYNMHNNSIPPNQASAGDEKGTHCTDTFDTVQIIKDVVMYGTSSKDGHATHNNDTVHAEDMWLLARTLRTIRMTGDAVEKMRLREALHLILYETESALAWHAKRARAKGRSDSDTYRILHAIMAARITMLHPFAPHTAESMWEALGYDAQVWSKNRWPVPKTDDSSTVAEATTLQAEDLLRSTLEDIASILKVTKITPSQITIYVADDRNNSEAADSAGPGKTSKKRAIYRGVLQAISEGDTSMGPIMKRLLANSATAGAKEIPDFVQKAIKDILSDSTDIREARTASDIFVESEFFSSEMPDIIRDMFGAKLAVYAESDPDIYDPKSKARHARPFKPAILVE